MLKVIERRTWSVVEVYPDETAECIEENGKYLIDVCADWANADEWDVERYFVMEDE